MKVSINTPARVATNQRLIAETKKLLDDAEKEIPQYYTKKQVLQVIETTIRCHMPRYMDNEEVKETTRRIFVAMVNEITLSNNQPCAD